jgi:hypothetical protein
VAPGRQRFGEAPPKLAFSVRLRNGVTVSAYTLERVLSEENLGEFPDRTLLFNNLFNEIAAHLSGARNDRITNGFLFLIGIWAVIEC